MSKGTLRPRPRCYIQDADLRRTPGGIEAMSAMEEVNPKSEVSDRIFARHVAHEWEELWIRQRKVSMSSAPSPCAGRLFGKRCGQTRPPYECEHHRPPGADHNSLWNRDGKPAIYLMQPYGLDAEEAMRLADWCSERGLWFAVDAFPSWHFPGKTILVEITRKGEHACHSH